MLKRAFLKVTSEPVLWSVALVALFFMGGNPSGPSLCVFHALGLGHCWGCGLGHAIHEALHLHWSASFAHHPLGIPVVLLLVARISTLLFSRTQNHDKWTINA